MTAIDEASSSSRRAAAAEMPRLMADLKDLVRDAAPHALLVGLFALTAVFGQLISNTATALIVVPIAVSAADQIAVSPRPVLMSVAVAAAAAFVTPIATPANLMIMGPAGYRSRRLLEAGPADARALLRRGRLPRAGRVVVLTAMRGSWP
jgi:hypothetical protein